MTYYQRLNALHRRVQGLASDAIAGRDDLLQRLSDKIDATPEFAAHEAEAFAAITNPAHPLHAVWHGC